MRKLIVTEFVTLDGVMEAPGGEPTHPHTGWVFDYIGDEQVEFKLLLQHGHPSILVAGSRTLVHTLMEHDLSPAT